MAAANKTGTLSVTLPSDREIRLTRVFNAPRGLIFEAMSKPEHVARWWGPREYTTMVSDMDFRVGGAWRFVLRMTDGSDHPFQGVYREIVPAERLVYTECYDVPSMGSPEWLTTITFEEFGGKTKLTLHRSAVALNGVAVSMLEGMKPGWTQSLDRLAEHLARS